MADQSRHAEWLSLIDRSGTFLTIPVLAETFPQGLGAIDEHVYKRTRDAYNEWREAVDEQDEDLAELHDAWIDFIFDEVLEFDNLDLDEIEEGEANEYQLNHPNGEEAFYPSFLLKSNSHKPLLLIKVLQPDVKLDSIAKGETWPLSFVERMIALCRHSNIAFGLLTNGEEWAIIYAPKHGPSSYGNWHARLWHQEKITFRAFVSLLSVRRWFGPANESLATTFQKSLEHNEELTNTLGEQVRQAVEVLIQSLDKADLDRNRNLLKDVSPQELYEAGLTVMMRLVFVLSAEERGLLLLGEATYDQFYAVSTLRNQLADESEKHGAEVLENRHDAWSRLLATFRAIYGGIDHATLRMPALGGSLFDPDRFPFLEGRDKNSTWKSVQHFIPLPINNRTVLLLLNALQVLDHSSGALLLSYKGLDVEQIGHVYEGLLEYTINRFPEFTLGLRGSQGAKNPNVLLGSLERLNADELIDLLKEATCRSESAIRRDLTKELNDEMIARLSYACGGDTGILKRIKPYANLLREDAWGDLLVYKPNSFAVTLGQGRRESGTHYTPKVLTEGIVKNTLEPLVYVGPATGEPRRSWKLKTSKEILDLKICDPAMGSGAFLVQSCRYLSERLVESWTSEIQNGLYITDDGNFHRGNSPKPPLPQSTEERLLVAKRLIAERCLYGVDINPLAVELAKLSIWLVTLSKGRPFGFLDHNLRSGDSLLGLNRLEQLTKFTLNVESTRMISLFASDIERSVKDAIALRTILRETAIRDIKDVQHMEMIDHKVRKDLEKLEQIADAIVGESIAAGGNEKAFEAAMDHLSTLAGSYLKGELEIGAKSISESGRHLIIDNPKNEPRKPFHWVLEFPEVFERGGFDGIVGNPPFLGGKKITTTLGVAYREYLVNNIAKGKKGAADLVAYFFLRAHELSNSESHIGLISTDSITNGDSFIVGLNQLDEIGATIHEAKSSIPWPGAFGGNISIIHWTRRIWQGAKILNGTPVNHITWTLSEASLSITNIYKLRTNVVGCFAGTYINGEGFILTNEERQRILAESPESNEIIRPYLTGDDVNTNYQSKATRYAIDFRTMTHAEASRYSSCLHHLTIKVKPYRDSIQKQIHEKDYWKFWDKRIDGYESIKDFTRVLVAARAAKDVFFNWVDNFQVFSDQLAVFITQSDGVFAVLESSLHNCWAWVLCTGKFGNGIRYAPSKAVTTFPLPMNADNLNEIGVIYYNLREALCKTEYLSLNQFYDKFHDPSVTGAQLKLRECKEQLDRKVLYQYGWDDLNLEHGFHETQQGVRFTVSKRARNEILERLSRLNHERHRLEINQASNYKPTAKQKPKSSIVEDQQGLFQ